MGTRVSETSAGQLQQHPDFEAAVAVSMQAAIELHRGSGLSNWLFNDRARAWFGYALLYLHATARPDDPQSGLTPERIKELAAEAGICSAGRAAAMLSLMRFSGYVELVPVAGDRRVRKLAPTAKLIAHQHERLRRQFEAIAMVLPETNNTRALLGQVEFDKAIAAAIGNEFMSGTRLLSGAPDLSPFAEASSGMMVLFSLMLSAQSDGVFTTDRPVTVSISELAKRFRVSRAQVRRLLREAERLGFLTRAGDDYASVILRPKLKRDLMTMFAAMFLFLAGAAAEAAVATGHAN